MTALRLLRAAAAGWLLVELWRCGVPWTPAFFLTLSWAALLWPEKEKRPASFAFFASLAVYLSTFRWHGGDDITNSLLPFAVLRHGTLAMNPVLSPFLDGKAGDFIVEHGPCKLSFHPIFTGLLALPLYVIPALSGAPVTERFLHNMSKISASCLVALSVAVFLKAVSAKAPRPWARALTLVYAFGTWSLSLSSQALFQHGPTQLGAALGFWGLYAARPALAGLGFGLAVAARGDGVFFAAAAGLYLLWKRPRELPRFVLGAAVPLGIVASYWLYYTGKLAEPGAARQLEGFGAFDGNAFAALMASPTRGLLFFCPAALFGPLALARREERPLASCFVAAFVAYWLFLGRFKNWTGGMSFGPRYFAMAATVLLLLSAAARPRRGAPWAAAAAFSIVVHALGAFLTWPGSFVLTEQVARAWDLRLHPVVNLLMGDGALGRLPLAVRLLILGLLAAAGLGLARRLRRVVY